jgi:hypothetical protein
MIASVRFFVATAVVLLSLQPLLGQTGKADNGFELKEIRFGYEARHDRFRFNFHNPSSFNTTALVPHEFVQTYTADSHRGVVKASYLPLRISWVGDWHDTAVNQLWG